MNFNCKADGLPFQVEVDEQNEETYFLKTWNSIKPYQNIEVEVELTQNDVTPKEIFLVIEELNIPLKLKNIKVRFSNEE